MFKKSNKAQYALLLNNSDQLTDDMDYEMRYRRSKDKTDSDDLDEHHIQYIKYGKKKPSAISKFCLNYDNFWDNLYEKCKPKKKYFSRVINLGKGSKSGKYPSNVICNQKYNFITFIPLVLFEQFSVFINMIFLVMACSQFVPALRVGYLYTYWGPLGFVIFVTMVREAIDDIRRWRRDREVNMAGYIKLTKGGQNMISSADIKVGDLIWLDKNQRIPADMVLLYTSEKNGACFIRTDQLDGETDWKLRHAVQISQQYVVSRNHAEESLYNLQSSIYAEAPNQNIHSFEGTFTSTVAGNTGQPTECSLSLEHTLWSNTVLASGSAVGLVIYTGTETRAVMNSNRARTKFGRIDREINNLNKLLIAFVIVLAFVMVALKGFVGPWPVYYWRFFLLFSYIIPLALRVNLDLAKVVYAFLISRDERLSGCVVRSTTIPEELGRVAYLLSDKTGTLTQNDMVLKKLHLGSVAYAQDSMDEVSQALRSHFSAEGGSDGIEGDQPRRSARTAVDKLVDAVMAIAVCHNVTPMAPQDAANEEAEVSLDTDPGDPSGYQASSPDEVALVNWTTSVGITLIKRDQRYISLRLPTGALKHFEILQDFPFTSETKRMGIILRDVVTKEIKLYVKGADTVMGLLVKYTAWLEDEVGNLAREGLRTLVVASKPLTDEQFNEFSGRLHQAKMSTVDRTQKVEQVVSTLIADLDMLCLTGVEDKLQEGVRISLETLRNAGIKVWMLTGDKMETAECIAKSSRLVGRGQLLHVFQPVSGRNDAHFELNAFRRRGESALVISGSSMEICLQYYEHEFMELTRSAPAVVVCRCSPTQKARIVRLLRRHTGQTVAAIGDGGNDVAMIQSADVGLGLEGKEGRQASLASDFSLALFGQCTRLLLVHGRNCYKNTASLAQFVMHRGLIISVMQAVFSAVYFFVAIQLFPGLLMVGYATIFTMFPVFSLVMDKDVPDHVAMTFPELYKDLAKGRDLTFKTFFIWFLISVYQGGMIMYGALFLFEDDFIHVVSITFTALILTELLMVALTVRTWHWVMVAAELLSLAIYLIALVVLKGFFDQKFLTTWKFVGKTLLITACSCIPLVILKIVRLKLRPPIYSRLQ